MNRNPYAPPSTDVNGSAPFEEAAVKSRRVPRPLSVWLLAVALSGFCFYLLIRAASSARALTSQGGALVRVPELVLSLVLFAGVGGCLALLVVCIFRGKPWCRWVGVALIAALGTAGLMSPDTTVYLNDAERAGGAIGRQFIIPSILFWWAYAYAFSKKARRFFSRSSGD